MCPADEEEKLTGFGGSVACRNGGKCRVLLSTGDPRVELDAVEEIAVGNVEEEETEVDVFTLTIGFGGRGSWTFLTRLFDSFNLASDFCTIGLTWISPSSISPSSISPTPASAPIPGTRYHHSRICSLPSPAKRSLSQAALATSAEGNSINAFPSLTFKSTRGLYGPKFDAHPRTNA